MTRVKIAEFGIIQKNLASAVVTFYTTNEDGSSTGIKATLYQAGTGTASRENPQTLTVDGKLSADCFVEGAVVAAISGINDRTERSLKKIRQNPLEFSLPITSSNFSNQAAGDLYGDLQAVEDAKDQAVAVLADAGFIVVSTDLLGANNIGTVSGSIASVNTVAGDLAGANNITVVGNELNAVDNNIETVADAIANVILTSSSITSVNTVATNIASVNSVASNATNINTVAAIDANVTTVALISANVTTVAGISADVTTVAAISSNVTTVAGNSAEIQILAPISANIQTVAGISANVTTVAGISANVSTVAAISTDVPVVAGISADISTLAALSSEIAILAPLSAEISDAAANIPKTNRTATTDPAAGNDNTEGYSAGSTWINISTNTFFVCVNAATGAAVWVDLTSAVGTAFAGLTDVTFTGLATGDFTSYNGLAWVNRTRAQVKADLDLEIGIDVQAYSSVLQNTTASFTTTLATKLNNIEANADVTDTTNVTSAGALMDSEVSSLTGIKTLSVPDNTTITTFAATLLDDTTNTAMRTTLGLGSLATLNNINNGNWSGTDLSVANGGTGVSTLTGIVKGNGTSAFSAAVNGTDYIASLAADTTPQLGGNLDVNGFSIVTAANGDIILEPQGTGDVLLNGIIYPKVDGGADQIIKTDGLGNLSFADAAGGGWVPLQTQTVSSAVASVDFTSGIDGTYKAYAVVVSGLVPTTDDVNFYIRTSSNAGSSYDVTAGNYKYTNNGVDSNGDAILAFSVSATQISIGSEVSNKAIGNNVLGESFNAVIYIYNPAAASLLTQIGGVFTYTTGQAASAAGTFAGQRATAGVVDAVRFLLESGNIASGTFTLYGLAGA